MPETLFPTQSLTLQALADRIIPADEFPSAWTAGAGEFLATLIVTEGSELLQLYRSGLDGLETEARLETGTSFSALPPTTQDELLRRVEFGQTRSHWESDPAHFFNLIVGHIIEGYYSNPAHGGNRQGRSWEMIGFTGAGDLEQS